MCRSGGCGNTEACSPSSELCRARPRDFSPYEEARSHLRYSASQDGAVAPLSPRLFYYENRPAELGSAWKYRVSRDPGDSRVLVARTREYRVAYPRSFRPPLYPRSSFSFSSHAAQLSLAARFSSHLAAADTPPHIFLSPRPSGPCPFRLSCALFDFLNYFLSYISFDLRHPSVHSGFRR